MKPTMDYYKVFSKKAFQVKSQQTEIRSIDKAHIIFNDEKFIFNIYLNALIYLKVRTFSKKLKKEKTSRRGYYKL